MKNILLWTFAILLTLGSAVYQRMTGPTHPVRGSVELAESQIKYRLIRSYPRPQDAPVRIRVEDQNVEGFFIYKRIPSHDSWKQLPLKREGEFLVAYIPQQPPAGKVQYLVSLQKGEEIVKLTPNPIVIRFRGDVPALFMIPHILFMFLAMLLSTRAGVAAIFAESNVWKLTLWTFITFVVGGLILGPIIQKYAFGDWWTGWPFGTDLTDNKTAFAFLFWAFALFRVYKNRKHRTWVIIASVVMLLIYLIPHSMLGSEIDFTQKLP